jgi:hypothetical protein
VVWPLEILQDITDVGYIDSGTHGEGALGELLALRRDGEPGARQLVDGLAQTDVALDAQSLHRCADVIVQRYRGSHASSLAHRDAGELLTGSANQALRLQDEHTLALQAKPAALGEIGQRLVHRLAGGADQLGDLLLGEVVGDP